MYGIKKAVKKLKSWYYRAFAIFVYGPSEEEIAAVQRFLDKASGTKR